jgi:hypothetical protein
MSYWWFFATMVFGVGSIAAAIVFFISYERVDVKGWKWAIASVASFAGLVGVIWVQFFH